VEMMQVTPYVKELIENGKIEEIREAMERAEDKVNQTFDQCLYKLIKQDKITLEEGLRKADSKNNLSLKFRLEKDEKDEKPDKDEKIEISINQNADFDKYNSYTIKPLKIRAKSETIKQKINMALMIALDNKGLRLVEGGAHLEVQYALGIKVEESMSLEPIGGKKSQFRFMGPPGKEFITLMINVVDVDTQQPVFRITASKRKSAYEESQGQLNAGISSLLKNFPVNR